METHEEESHRRQHSVDRLGLITQAWTSFGPLIEALLRDRVVMITTRDEATSDKSDQEAQD